MVNDYNNDGNIDIMKLGSVASVKVKIKTTIFP